MSGQSKKSKWLIFVGCILALCFLLVAPLFAQESDVVCDQVQFFPDTNHVVCDQFLEFFNSRGGVRIFGFPITEQFEEQGRLVQYFQRVRMEYHPELSPPYQVQLGLLGDFFAPPDRKARIPESSKPKSNDPQRRYFPETGHSVEYSFLKFFDEDGGLDIFGYPVTEFMLENGRVVQYFQRALMEWDPNQGGIVLHNLGEFWVNQHEDLLGFVGSVPQLAPGSESILALPAVTSLRVTASVRDAFTGLDGEQVVWVYVNDQNNRPLEGAQVKLVVPFLADPVLVMSPTDEFGHTQITFKLSGLTPGQLAVVDAQVDYEGLTAHVRAFFFAWW